MAKANRQRKQQVSIRWQEWDYGWDAAYFITICTKNRNHYFGKILKGEAILSPVGEIAHKLWFEIPNHAQNIELGAFIVMPNHIHGIIILNSNPEENQRNVRTGHALPRRPKETLDAKEDQQQKPGQNRFQNIGKNTISSIIGSYKSAVTKHANLAELEFGWQRLFHDNVIRNEIAFERISNYIVNNPKKWDEDTFHL